MVHGFEENFEKKTKHGIIIPTDCISGVGGDLDFKNSLFGTWASAASRQPASHTISAIVVFTESLSHYLANELMSRLLSNQLQWVNYCGV